MSAPNNTITIIDPPAVANLMDIGRFNQMMTIAQTMATASLIPEHLLGKKKGGVIEYFTAEEIRCNCFLIVNQAFRWGMDPFAVMPETYVVGGKLGYQGKLVAAVVNGLANLDERLSYEFTGDPTSDDFTVTVSGRIRGEDKPRTVKVRVGSVKTDNQMWKKDPEQKLVYTGATKWARRHCPEIILGIIVDDEMEQEPMKEAHGRVLPDTNPYADAPKETPKAAPAKQTRKPAPAASAPVEEPAEDGSNVATGLVDIPSTDEILADLTQACTDAKISPQSAAKKYREYGVVPEGVKMADLTHKQLFEVWKVREIALQSKNEQAP